MSASDIPKYLYDSFSLSILMTTWFYGSTLSLCVVSHFSLQASCIFYAKFHYYILTVYSHSFYLGFQFLFVFGKKFDVVLVHQEVNLFLQITEIHKK